MEEIQVMGLRLRRLPSTELQDYKPKKECEYLDNGACDTCTCDKCQLNGYEIERGGSLSYGEIPDLTGLPGVHIECKRVERLNVPEAMQQAVRDSERFHDGLPALFHRRNRQPWLVTLRLEDFMRLYGQQK